MGGKKRAYKALGVAVLTFSVFALSGCAQVLENLGAENAESQIEAGTAEGPNPQGPAKSKLSDEVIVIPGSTSGERQTIEPDSFRSTRSSTTKSTAPTTSASTASNSPVTSPTSAPSSSVRQTLPSGPCSQQFPSAVTEQVVAYYSVSRQDQSLTLCEGSPSGSLVEHWIDLVEISDTADVGKIVAIGLVSDPTSPFSATVYPMSSNTFRLTVNEAEIDNPLLPVVLVHELSHVLQFTSDQIRLGSSTENCSVPHVNGCFEADSYVSQWSSEFWFDVDLAAITDDAAELTDRCLANPGFPSNYSAKHPTEDFADSFSYYVFDIEVPSEAQPRLDFFDDFPEFKDMRDRARQSSPLSGKYRIEPESRCAV